MLTCGVCCSGTNVKIGSQTTQDRHMSHPDQIADRQLCDVASNCVEVSLIWMISEESARL